jgi:hypothetical protein
MEFFAGGVSLNDGYVELAVPGQPSSSIQEIPTLDVAREPPELRTYFHM